MKFKDSEEKVALPQPPETEERTVELTELFQTIENRGPRRISTLTADMNVAHGDWYFASPGELTWRTAPRNDLAQNSDLEDLRARVDRIEAELRRLINDHEP